MIMRKTLEVRAERIRLSAIRIENERTCDEMAQHDARAVMKCMFQLFQKCSTKNKFNLVEVISVFNVEYCCFTVKVPFWFVVLINRKDIQKGFLNTLRFYENAFKCACSCLTVKCVLILCQRTKEKGPDSREVSVGAQFVTRQCFPPPVLVLVLVNSNCEPNLFVSTKIFWIIFPLVDFCKRLRQKWRKKSWNYTFIFAKKWRKLPPLKVYLIEKKCSRVSTRIVCEVKKKCCCFSFVFWVKQNSDKIDIYRHLLVTPSGFKSALFFFF